MVLLIPSAVFRTQEFGAGSVSGICAGNQREAAFIVTSTIEEKTKTRICITALWYVAIDSNPVKCAAHQTGLFDVVAYVGLVAYIE